MAHTLIFTATLSCATIAGVFFAFSAFVMNGLSQLPPAQGIAAMQSINISAVRPKFMIALFGTAAMCVTLVIRGFLIWGERPAGFLVAGGGIYLVGTILLTIGYHVPLNNGLASTQPNSAEATIPWAAYLTHWTRWNHVRAAAALVASLMFGLALTT